MIELATGAAVLALIGLAVFMVGARSWVARWPLGLPVIALSAWAASWAAALAFRAAESAPPIFVALFVSLLTFEIVLRPMRWPGRLFFGSMVVLVVAFVAAIVTVTFGTRIPALGLGLSMLLLVLEVATLGLSLTFAYEIADVLGRDSPTPQPRASYEPYAPRVCIQVPAYNEPPDLLRQTLEALAVVDYPHFIVQVVVNNTTDPSLWRPVEEDCQRLGPRFRFVHLPSWPGFKAGALNEATRRLDSDVEIVGIVDADYLVRPDFLESCVPYLADPDVAFVQTPQHYRDWQDSPYLRGLFYAYRYFFDVTMVARARVNAIIFGGTMGLIRVAALREIGGWAEWCITEDAEASLRLLARGWRAVYVHRVFGEGLMPLDFDGLRRQRFRWAFGGVQIMRRHLRVLLGLTRSRLTPAQRYHYLVGGLGWFADPLGVALALFLLATSPFIALGHPLLLRQLVGALFVLPILILVAGLLRLGWSIRKACGAPWRDVPLAAMVMLALSWTVARACMSALFRTRGVFLRTPKVRTPSRIGRAVLATLPESTVAAACASMAVAVGIFGPPTLGAICAVLLAWQAVAWGSAPVASLLSLNIPLTPARIAFKRSPQTTGARPWLLPDRPRRLVLAFALVLAAIFLTPALATAPGADSSLQQALGGVLPPVIAQAGGEHSPRPTATSASSTPPAAGPPATSNPTAKSTPVATASPGPRPSPSPLPSPTSHPTGRPTALPSPTPHGANPPRLSPTPT
ncbi:MAG TPA: glycosyltransferase [Candidatus Micrarchaeaceae archaeon]|nr:glycosyltransferase [Candidatus Micrarchaeaceae archaeon]